MRTKTDENVGSDPPKSYNLYAALRPLWIVLAVYGIRPRLSCGAVKSKCLVKTCTRMVQVMHAITALFYCGFSILVIVKLRKLSEIDFGMYAFVWVASISFWKISTCFYVLSKRQSKLEDFFISLSKMSVSTLDTDSRLLSRIRNTVWFMTFLPFALVAYIAAMLVHLWHRNSVFQTFEDIIQTDLLNSSKVFHVNSDDTNLVSHKTFMAYLPFLLVGGYLINLFYDLHFLGFMLTVTKVLGCMFESLEQKFVAANEELQNLTSLKPKAVRIFIKEHKNICALVQSADAIFREIFFCAYVAELSSIILMLRTWDLDRESPISEFFEVLLLMSTPFLTNVGGIVRRTQLSAKVNHKVLSSLKVVLNVDVEDDEDCPSAELSHKILQYTRYVQMAPPSLTGWSFFNIECGCILTMGGYILTYTLMLYGIG